MVNKSVNINTNCLLFFVFLFLVFVFCFFLFLFFEKCKQKHLFYVNIPLKKKNPSSFSQLDSIISTCLLG